MLQVRRWLKIIEKYNVNPPVEASSYVFNKMPAVREIEGGYLDFSHLTELENIYIYITEIYMRKHYKLSKIKNKKNYFFFFYGGSLNRLRSLLSYFQIWRQKSKTALWEKSSD